MRKFGLALFASASVFSSSVALAQNAPAAAPDPAAEPQGGGVGDIVVTGQRRSQNILSVPLSIQATSGQQLNDTGIRQISSLQFTTPGMFVQNGVGYTQVYIRG